jgi:hypothetical protein
MCYYKKFECSLHPNPRFTMSFYQVGKLFGKMTAATAENAVRGFRKAGL